MDAFADRLFPCACWRERLSPTARRVIIRLVIRAAMVGVIVALIRTYASEARSAGAVVFDWLHSLGTPASEFTYFGVAAIFCAVSPTGYLPAIAAGIAYSPSAAIPITYAAVNVGALINVLLVRNIFERRLPGGMAAKYAARGATLLGSSGLARAIRVRPVRIVALLRTPFLGNGALNYILSLHADLRVRDMLFGNAIGFIPGSVLFPVAGNQLRSLGALLANAGTHETAADLDASIGWFIGISVTVGVSIAAVVTIVKRVLAREDAADAQATAESKKAAADFVPSIVVYSDDDIASLTAALRQPLVLAVAEGV